MLVLSLFLSFYAIFCRSNDFWTELKRVCLGGSVVVFNLKDGKQTTELRKLLGLEALSLSIMRSRLQWFGRVEREETMQTG